MIALKKITAVGVYTVCIIVLCQFKNINGIVTISPFPRASVCRVGDHLEVICSITNETILDWEFVFTGTNDRIVRTVTSTQQVQEVVPSHSTVFIFSRTSELGTLPLVSTLEIAAVRLPLNGSTITCMGSPSAVATTTVHIVGENDAYCPNQPEVSLKEEFGVDNVTVFLQWTEELNNSLLTYHVSAEPMAQINNGNGRANITLLYNTPYNVSVVADFCDRTNATTTLLNYVNCGAPLNESASSVMIMGYSGVTLEGDSVSFTCSSGLLLTVPNSSMCMGNGEWEPDPRELACKGDDTSSSSHPPLSGAGKIAVASISVFLVTFALAFTIGYVTGRCRRKKSSESAEMNVAPLYDTIQSEHSKRDVAMSENIAYSIVQPSL